MTPKFSLDDYIDVAERIQIFKEAYPDGSLQRRSWSIETVGDRQFVVYTAVAHRTPDDKCPGIGTAWEPFPGQTPYTRDSELMNAETAAWGRAIVALGIVANRKIASRQEVQARQGDGEAKGQKQSLRPSRDRPPTAKQLTYLKKLVTTAKNQGATAGVLRAILDDAGAKDITIAEGWMEQLNGAQVSSLIDMFREGVLPDPDAPPDVPTDIEPPEQPELGDASDIPFDVGEAA